MKKTISKIILCVLLISAVIAPRCAHAVEPEKLITDVSILNAKLYLSDWNDNEVILTKVRPIRAADTVGTEASKALEYTAVPAFDRNVWDAREGGSELDLKSLAWFLDMDVRVTTVKLVDGTYRVERIQVIDK